MTAYDAVLFDMDNTLHNLYAARFCAADALMAYKGVFPDLHFYALNRDNPDLVRRSITDFFAENHLDDVDEAVRLYQMLELACLREFSGMQGVLHTLKASGVKLAVVSNADIRSSAARLKEMNLDGFFDLVVTPETFGVKKPNPLVFQKTLEALGVTPERAVMIGDKEDRDVLPARVAGLDAVHAWFGSLDGKDEICCAEEPADILRLLKKS
ncbi:MAG: HAD family hydrolase [Methanocorpusculum sp.]|nr:HAD family hydrolase [Methanocorpusculum sp.]